MMEARTGLLQLGLIGRAAKKMQVAVETMTAPSCEEKADARGKQGRDRPVRVLGRKLKGFDVCHRNHSPKTRQPGASVAWGVDI